LGDDEEGRQGSRGSHIFRYDSALASELLVLTVPSTEILKMVNIKKETKLAGRKRATLDSTSKKGTWGEGKKELTLSKDIIEDSNEELAHLDN
jgi:hypothetical protein